MCHLRKIAGSPSRQGSAQIAVKNVIRRFALDFFGHRRENAMWRANVAVIDARKCSSLLLLGLDGKLGDAIMQSALVRELSAWAPECRIIVVSTPGVADYWRACAGVAQVHVVPSRSGSTTRRRLLILRRLARSDALGSVDVALSFDPIPMLDYFAFLHWLRARTSIGLSMTHYALFGVSIADPILEVPRRHAGERIVRVLAALGVERQLEDLRGLLPLTALSVATQRAHARSRSIFLNGFGASPTRTFASAQLATLADALLAVDPTAAIIVNANTAQRASGELRALLERQGPRVRLFPDASPVTALFEAIAASHVVLTPDTSVAHIAAAADVPLVVAFDDVDFNPICWRPLSRRALNLVPASPRSIADFPPAILLAALARVSAV
jgi:ADP-heptose:LPS heptosyltransferase